MINMKRIISLLVCFAILSTSLVGTLGIFSTLAVGSSNVEDTVIYDTDFADATVRANRDNTADSCGDAYPVADPLNSSAKAVLYNGGWYNNGIIFIGSKMTTNNENSSLAISAEAGASYKIEFSYYVTGKLSNPTGNPLKIGLRVRSTTGNNVNEGGAKYNCSYEEEILSINQAEDFAMTGYKTETATVKIPKGVNFSTYGDKLGLYLRGQGVNVYIGSIKVTKLAPVDDSGNILCNIDYSSANTNTSRPSKPFATAGNDVLPVKDPDNADNKVLEVKKSTADWSYVYLGAEYKSKTEVTASSITAEPGTTYEIEFVYKIREINSGAALNNFNIGICLVGANTTEPNDTTWGNNTVNTNSKLFITKDTVSATDGWVNYKTEYVVPSDADLSVTDKLAILCNISTLKYAIYFDNVKVTKLASANGDTVIYDTDFSNATVRSDPWSTGDSCGGCWPVLSTVDDTNNKVIKHTPGYWGHGVIPVGAPMTANNQNSAAAITAEAGATYHVEFDYYLSGTNNNSAYEIGLEVGNVSGQAKDQGPAYSFRQSILSFPQNTTFEGKWKKASADITIPEGTDFSNGDKLMIYFLNGHGSNVLYYYDNLKITKLASVNSDAVIYNTDFADATVRSNRDNTADSCGDAYPVSDPLDPSKKAVLYNGGWYNNGIIFIGSKMTDNNENSSLAISAEAGAKYKIEFSYYVTGKLSNPTGNPLRIGLRVRSTTGNNENAGNAKYNCSYQKEILSINQSETFAMTEYKPVTATVTIPKGTDFSTYGDKLGLYLMGQGVNVYIGSIKVTKLPEEEEEEDNGIDGDGDTSEGIIYNTTFKYATVRSDRSQSDAFGDAYPVADPLNPSKNAVLYNGGWYNNGMIFFGSKMQSAAETKNSAISAETATSYKVEFSYYVTGKLSNPQGNPLRIGLRVRSAEGNSVNEDNAKYNYSYQEEILSLNQFEEFNMTDYKTVSDIITIPKDIDFSTYGDKLGLYLMGQGVNVYIGHIKVTKLDEMLCKIKFDSNGGNEFEPLFGKKGEPYTLPKNVTKEDCEFVGWYKDAELTEEVTDGDFSKETMTLYAKYKRIQYIQGFEDDFVKYPVVISDWFEFAFWFNTPHDCGDRMPWCHWTGEGLEYQYDPTGVRSGDNSVYNPGGNAQERLFTLLLKEPLAVGEKYTLSLWIKVDDYTVAGDVKLWFNNGKWNSNKLRTDVDWSSKESRYITMVNTNSMKDHLGEWLEIKFDFEARGKFIGIGIPGLTTCWVDDARVTLASADESFIRTTEGDGLKYEDWYGSGNSDEQDVYVPKEDVDEPVIIKYADLPGYSEYTDNQNNMSDNNYNDNNYETDESDSDEKDSNKQQGTKKVLVKVKKKKNPQANTDGFLFPVWGYVIIAAAVVLAGGAVATVVIIKRKKSKQ